MQVEDLIYWPLQPKFLLTSLGSGWVPGIPLVLFFLLKVLHTAWRTSNPEVPALLFSEDLHTGSLIFDDCHTFCCESRIPVSLISTSFAVPFLWIHTTGKKCGNTNAQKLLMPSYFIFFWDHEHRRQDKTLHYYLEDHGIDTFAFHFKGK